MRSGRAILLIGTGLLLSALPPAGASPGVTASIGKVGQSVFWPSTKSASTSYSTDPTRLPNDQPVQALNDVATLVLGEKTYEWAYTLKVAPKGHRLRVAFDAPSAYEMHVIDLISPSGESTTTASGFNSGEVVAMAPAAGVWKVRITSYFDLSNFRLRARLEPAPAPYRGKKKALLPNLRLIPPFEFTFANPYRGTFRYDGGAAVPAPDGTANCWFDEVAEHSASKCLRFSLGPINEGVGPLDMVFEGNGAGIATPCATTQIVHYTDASTTERYAGQCTFHKTHMHYHHTGFGKLELLKVTDPAKGTMVAAGEGPKQGFCTADVVAYQWTRFAGVQNEAKSECLTSMSPAGTYSPTGTQMGISPGWADIYDWSQSGNYVEFGSNTDGRYVVRSTADQAGYVIESNERDNTSYAYIEINGTHIKVLERGFGMGPWDKHKELAHDILRSTPKDFTS